MSLNAIIRVFLVAQVAQVLFHFCSDALLLRCSTGDEKIVADGQGLTRSASRLAYPLWGQTGR
jgi:hypothetical protein